MFFFASLLRRVEGLIAQGALSKAARHLTSLGILDVQDAGVQDALRLLHPGGAPCPGIPIGFQEHAIFSDEEEEKRERLKTLLSLIRSFDVASAPGPTGLRPDHLKDLLDDNASPGATDLLQALAHMAHSGAPSVDAGVTLGSRWGHAGVTLGCT